MEYASKLLIGGELVDSASTNKIEVEDPATGQGVAQVPAGNAADIDRAVAAARACFERGTWTARTPAERSVAMWKLSNAIEAETEEIARLDVIDNGMPLAFARATVGSAVNSLRYYAGMCNKVHGITSTISAPGRDVHAYTLPEPVGVVGIITPWNAPFSTLINKLAPALAAGCPVVAKPAEQTPLSALHLAKLVAGLDLPAGLINIVTGIGTEAGAALANHADVDKLSFTGSTAVGKSLVHAAAGNLKRLTLELGGKSPVFVFNDADLDRAIPAVVMAIFNNSGQVCFAGSRLYIQRQIFDEVVERVGKAAQELRLGNGFDPQSQLGPVVSGKQMERVLDYVKNGISEGAELVCGGARHGEQGYFVAPTVFSNHRSLDLTVTREEIFGPVLTAMPFDDLDQVAHLANATPYGLGAGIFTTNVSTAHTAAKRIRAGNVWINCYGVLDKSMPFGGYKQSGWGREFGYQGIEAFLETKAVYTLLG